MSSPSPEVHNHPLAWLFSAPLLAKPSPSHLGLVRFGDYQGPQSLWQAAWWGAGHSPRYWWSGHHLITAQMQGSLTVSGTTSSPRADTTKSLSGPKAAWARCGHQPRRARCPLNTDPLGNPGDGLVWSLQASSELGPQTYCFTFLGLPRVPPLKNGETDP